MGGFFAVPFKSMSFDITDVADQVSHMADRLSWCRKGEDGQNMPMRRGSMWGRDDGTEPRGLAGGILDGDK
jgi:hypothetical protein